MHRSPSLRASFLAAGIVAGATLVACLTDELVNVGSNVDASEPDVDVPDVGPVEATVDADMNETRAPVGDAPLDVDIDAAPPRVFDLCIPNPSFETNPAEGDASPVQSAPPGWTACNGANGQSGSNCSLAPADGSTYLGLSIGFPRLFLGPASVDVTPCAPIVEGATYGLSVDVALDAPGADGGQPGEPPVLQLRGSTNECDAQGDLLWRFSGISACGWKTLCGTFVARASYTHLLLIPETNTSTADVFADTNLLVDDLQPGDVCQAP
jgi:hypothetical protein